ncbi:hypothetical protein DL764_000621 [Monosporascus ibericus]|uniref:Delta(24)-sterol reductase n=1 Tax=Monosporascus ibericus TaxID=155417 RepID=A0A4Q4TUD6_9PEZI|nr:hypothetical protein DL764_000621 [Monosporascus ibericus]
MDAHNAAVATISERVREFYTRKEPFRVYHGSTNSTRTSARNRDNTVDTSNLNHVLRVDAETKVVLVEPNVSMDRLLDATMERSLIPPVVMELPAITVGGGFSGMAGESSCFRYGPFDCIVNSIEIVLGNGDVARASRTEKPDLFWGAVCAFGTMGIVTLLELQLRDAKGFVELTHYPFSSFPAASAKIQEETKKPDVDFVDGIAFSPSSIVVCSGRLVDAVPAGSAPRRYTGRADPWFYLDVEKRTENGTKQVTDYVPVVDYFFRWDRGAFWVAKYAFSYFVTPFNRITRYLLDRFMHAKIMYHALHKSGLSDQYIIQDVGVPYEAAEEFHEWLHQTVNIYPLWLCPIRLRRDTPDSGHGLHADFADPTTPEVCLNFGVWGPGAGVRNYDDFVRQNRAIEQKVQELRGKKTLYACNYYTEDEFWTVYNRTRYDAVREKYHASWLPSVYDKIIVDEAAKQRAVDTSRLPNSLRNVWPFQGLYGVYKAWRGGDYLLQSKKAHRDHASKKDV